jgi:glycogen(starch) synthase
LEIAWEVCNQIGGIYTVLKTKASVMVERWGKNYLLVGPYTPETAAIEFEETTPDESIRILLDNLRKRGIPCYYGRWLVDGRPQVLLIDFRPALSNINDRKYFLWKDHGIEGLDADPGVNEPIAFGFSVFELLKEACGIYRDRQILAHFHEWMAGVAVPLIAGYDQHLHSIFTTHATLLGRYIASDNPNFYRDLDSIDSDSAARHYNISARHTIERQAARRASVFTTVSEVTAREAERLLGRKPDAILPNGLNVQRFTALHEFQNLHLKFKERIHEFVMGHFFPSYTFDLDRTLYIFTSGRYEFRNKGMDLFIEALHRLNLKLREIQNPPTVVAFIVTRAPYRNVNVSALQSHLMFDELKNICMEVESGAGQRLLAAVSRGRLPRYEEFLSNDSQVRLKRAIHALKSSKLPSIVTHDLNDDKNDAIMNHLRHRQLYNASSDPVKVVFHPDFITATSPLFSLDYDQFVRGCHLGVFPSYYEPWGYTPLECIALGLPAVTTDLSGFGAYVQKNIPDARDQGILVLNRSKQDSNQVIDELVNYFLQFVQLGRRERIELRNRSERLTQKFDWAVLAENYHRAHEMALGR